MEHFKSKFARPELLEIWTKIEIYYLRAIFPLLPLPQAFVDVFFHLPNGAGWDTQTDVCLHCCHLSELPGWMLSICRNLVPSVQPSPADSLQRSCEKRWDRITESSARSSSLTCSFCCWSSPPPAVAAEPSPQHLLGYCDSSQPASHFP